MDPFAASRAGLRRGVPFALLCILVSSPASADLILTGSEGSASVSLFFGGGLPERTDEETFGPFGGAAVAEVGRNRAVQTGAGINAVNVEARLSDIPFIDFRADTDIEWDIENTGPDAQDLRFSYTINGGQLRLFDQTGAFEGLTSTIAVRIFTLFASDFSGTLWEWGVTLQGTGAGVVAAHEHGFGSIFDFHDPLGLGSPNVSAVTMSSTEAVVTIAPFTGTVNLGEMRAGERVSISYSMFGELFGRPLNGAGGSATVGDPFDLSGVPGSVLQFNGETATVPEPSVLVLLGTGLAMLFRTRAKRRGGV